MITADTSPTSHTTNATRLTVHDAHRATPPASAQRFRQLLPHRALVRLPDLRDRDRLHELDVLRRLHTPLLIADERPDLLGERGRSALAGSHLASRHPGDRHLGDGALPQYDGGDQSLAPVRVRHADDAGLGDGGMLEHPGLDLGGVDVESTGDDHVLLAAHDAEEA